MQRVHMSTLVTGNMMMVVLFYTAPTAEEWKVKAGRQEKKRKRPRGRAEGRRVIPLGSFAYFSVGCWAAAAADVDIITCCSDHTTPHGPVHTPNHPMNVRPGERRSWNRYFRQVLICIPIPRSFVPIRSALEWMVQQQQRQNSEKQGS